MTCRVKEFVKKKFAWEIKLKTAKILSRQNPTADNRMASNLLSEQFTKLYLSKTDEYFIQIGEEIA